MSKEERSKKNAAWRAANKDHIREYGAEWWRKNGARYAASPRNRTAEGKEARAMAGRAKRARLRMEAFNAYGGAKCACCGETLIEGLTIDHIGGDGARHRRETPSQATGRGFYAWLKANEYPRGYQVLCATCNLAKGTDDHCPHEDLRIAWG